MAKPDIGECQAPKPSALSKKILVFFEDETITNFKNARLFFLIFGGK